MKGPRLSFAAGLLAVLCLGLTAGCGPLKEEPKAASIPASKLPPPLPADTPPATTPSGYSAMVTSADFKLSSPAFGDGEKIPVEYTADGAGTSPALSWTGVPNQAAELALIVEDPDAPGGDFAHWIVWGIPATRDNLKGALPAKAKPEGEGGITQGRNDGGKSGYYPPAPPPGKAHHYEFRLLALDTHLNLPTSATKKEFRAAVGQHAIAAAQITGVYER